jgi:hypothetical protein
MVVDSKDVTPECFYPGSIVGNGRRDRSLQPGFPIEAFGNDRLPEVSEYLLCNEAGESDP